MTRTHLLAASLVALGLSACQSYPERRPDLGVLPTTYPAGPLAGAAVAGQDWTLVVRDERLRRLVELSLSENRDLRTALLEVQAARALSQAQDASFFPQVQAAAQRSETRQPMMQGVLPETTQVGVSLTAFELDLFGRLRAQSQSAFAAYLAAE